MKKFFIFLIVSSGIPVFSLACDICGCGAGNNYIGILPEFRKQVFGVRYRYNTLHSHVGINGSSTYLTTKENYRIMEAWGGWNIRKNIRIMASIPYNFNNRTNQGITKTKTGLGDISIWGYYQLINKKKTVFKSKLLVQTLWAGAGIKLPTGKYNPSDKNNGTSDVNLFQLGTGSFDFNTSLMYDVRLQDVGINLTANYKINTTNKYDYRYGSKLNLNTQLYYKFNIKNKIVLAPNAGIQYEYSDNDTDKTFSVAVSGGKLVSGMAGMEIAYKKIAAGFNFQTALSQQLAMGIVKAGNRFMIHCAFAL